MPSRTGAQVEAERGRTSLFGREPNAGKGLPSSPNTLPQPVAPEKSKSHSTIACIALGAKPVPAEFDESFAFLRAPEPYVYRDTLQQQPSSSSWLPSDRPVVALAEDRAAGTTPHA